MLKKIISLLLSLSLVLGICMMAPMVYAAEFANAEDISTEYLEAVDLLTALNMMDNRVEEPFQPTSTITREEMARMIAVLANAGNDVSNLYVSDFADVPKDRWSASYITYCAKTGIIAGRSATTFDPTGKVTGLETAKMLLVLLGFDAEEQGYVGADWKENVLRDAKAAGLLDGMPEDYDTDDPITREDAAQMMLRALDAPMPTGETLVQKNYGMESVEQLKDTVLPYTMEEAEEAAQQITLGPYCDPEELEEPEEENPDRKISSTSYAQVVLDAAAEATGIPAVRVTEPAIYLTDGTLVAKVSGDVITATMRQNYKADTAMKQLLGSDAKAVAAAVGTPELSKQITAIREKHVAELAERTPAVFQNWTKVTDRYQSEDSAALYSAIAFGALDVYDATGSSVSADPDAPMTWAEMAKFFAYLMLGKKGAEALADQPYVFTPGTQIRQPNAPYIDWIIMNDYFPDIPDDWNEPITSNEFGKILYSILGENEDIVIADHLRKRMQQIRNDSDLVSRGVAAQLLCDIAALEVKSDTSKTLGDAIGYVYTAPPVKVTGTSENHSTYTASTVIPAGMPVTVAVDDKGEITVHGAMEGPDLTIAGEPVKTFHVVPDQSVTVETLGHIITKILQGTADDSKTLFDVYDSTTWDNVESYSFQVTKEGGKGNQVTSSRVSYVPTEDGDYRVITETSEDFTQGLKEKVENMDPLKDEGLANAASDLRDETEEKTLVDNWENPELNTGNYELIGPGAFYDPTEEEDVEMIPGDSDTEIGVITKEGAELEAEAESTPQTDLIPTDELPENTPAPTNEAPATLSEEPVADSVSDTPSNAPSPANEVPADETPSDDASSDETPAPVNEEPIDEEPTNETPINETPAPANESAPSGDSTPVSEPAPTSDPAPASDPVDSENTGSEPAAE